MTILCFCHATDEVYSYKFSLYRVITWKLLFGEGIFLEREKNICFVARWDSSPIYKFFSQTVGLEECGWSEYCNNFKKSERAYIFLKSNKFTACKVRDGKEVNNSLMVFNLHKISYPFQNNTYLRT